MRQKVIYGEDDRMDIYLVTDEAVKANSGSVAAIFTHDEITANTDGTVSLPNRTFASEFEASGNPLCPDEPFQSQPVGAICTAFLVGDDLVATAGHCLNESNLHTRRFVFGYTMASAEVSNTTIPASDVYMGTEILGWQLDSSAADWALVKLDRKVINRNPLTIRTTGEVAINTGLYVLGHPVGLPQKYASNAEVRHNEHNDFFIANLDTFGGNSGSPVFNATTHEVEGILVRGEVDFAPKGQCVVSLLCPVQGCRGEDCTRITLLSPFLPSLPADG